MLIHEIGGEFALIDRLSRMIPCSAKDIVVGIGDDAAVLKIDDTSRDYLLVTTDTMVEHDHFNRSWSQPDQIGIKAAESNISDIAAMGGVPTLMFISLTLTPDISVEWAEKLYEGIAQSCTEHQVAVAGGNITHGSIASITITLLGKVPPEHLRLRSHAQPGDILAVTGPLGASTAALKLLRKGLPVSPYLLHKHLTPHCRLDASKLLAPIARAMIDISDGLASEVSHICEQSRVGAIVNAADIPLHPDVIDAGKRLGIDPIEWALSGGEDFELLFSIAPQHLDFLRKTELSYYPVGRITDISQGRRLLTASGDKVPLTGGYDHFSADR